MIVAAQSWLVQAFKAIRWHQWAKNILLLVPLIAAHRVNDPTALLAASIAWFAWGLSASAGYVFNDLLDANADRAHPLKRLRPFASNTFSISSSIGLIIVLLAMSAGLTFLLPGDFALMLLLYLALSVSYSIALKKIQLLDVLVLASLYTLRIFAGATATDIDLSKWLLVFSLFFFFSLALVKRYAELRLSEPNTDLALNRRGYSVNDSALIGNFGAASALTSVLVFVLYVTSSDVQALYSRPAILLLLFPLMLYWLIRTWLLAHRGRIADDPVVFALRDPITYMLIALGAIILWLAV